MKPLFVQIRIDSYTLVNKVFIHGGATVKLIMPEGLIKRLKSSKFKGIIVLNIKLGTITRNTMFVVVVSKANYNLLLGREWIHAVGALPSTLHTESIIME